MIEATLKICGATTLWTLGRTNRATLKAALAPLGLDSHVPEARSPKAILKDVLIGTYADAKKMVRPLAKRDAFTIVSETRGESVNQYDNDMLVEVNEDGKVIATPDRDQAALQAAYDATANILPVATVGGLLSTIVGVLNGIPLRPSGGVYWLPADRLEKWVKVAGAFEGAVVGDEKSAVYVLRSQADAQALRAVRDALQSQLTGEIARMQEEIDRGVLGEDALNARVETAKAMHTRLAEYEQLLGETLTAVHSSIDAVKTSAAKALIYASAASGPVTA